MQSKSRFLRRGHGSKTKTNNRRRTSGRIIQCVQQSKGWRVITKFIRHYNFQ